MTIQYRGKNYTVGNRYIIYIYNYRLKQNTDDHPTIGMTKVRAKLVLKRYMDDEMYSTNHHYGFVFEYPRVWNGVERTDEITLPDAIGDNHE